MHARNKGHRQYIWDPLVECYYLSKEKLVCEADYNYKVEDIFYEPVKIIWNPELYPSKAIVCPRPDCDCAEQRTRVWKKRKLYLLECNAYLYFHSFNCSRCNLHFSTISHDFLSSQHRQGVKLYNDFEYFVSHKALVSRDFIYCIHDYMISQGKFSEQQQKQQQHL